MRELKPKCAARIFFDFFWAFMAPGSNNYKCRVDYSVDRDREREREERERKVLSLRVCILDFSHLASASTVVSLVQSSRRRQSPTCPCTWHLIHGQGKRERDGKGEQEEESTHCQAVPAGNRTPSCCSWSWSLSNANCLGLLSSPNLALAFQIV